MLLFLLFFSLLMLFMWVPTSSNQPASQPTSFEVSEQKKETKIEAEMKML